MILLPIVIQGEPYFIIIPNPPPHTGFNEILYILLLYLIISFSNQIIFKIINDRFHYCMKEMKIILLLLVNSVKKIMLSQQSVTLNYCANNLKNVHLHSYYFYLKHYVFFHSCKARLIKSDLLTVYSAHTYSKQNVDL